MLVGAGTASLLLIAMTACGASKDTTAKPSEAQTRAGDQSSTDKTYQVGEAAQLFDIKLTVDDVQKVDSYNQQVLQEGTEFVLVKVTLQNMGSEKKKYNVNSFSLISSAPKPDLSVATLNAEAELHEGELAPGAKVSGLLPFEQPKNDPVMKLEFRPNMMSPNKIIVQLK